MKPLLLLFVIATGWSAEKIAAPPAGSDPVGVGGNASIPDYAAQSGEELRREYLTKYPKALSDVSYSFHYDEQGQACLTLKVVPANGYRWEQNEWVARWWGNSSGTIGNGRIAYVLTKKNADAAERRMQERRKDPVFAEMEALVYQIAKDWDYDFYAAYGMSVKYRNPKVKRAVCDGYADAVIDAMRSCPSVRKVEKWTGGNHAWNKIILKDDRVLFCDATWYDGNSVDAEGYVVDIPVRNPADLTFDQAEFDSLANAVDRRTGRTLAVHFGWPGCVQSR